MSVQHGVTFREVSVISIDGGKALVIDRFGTQMRLRLDLRRGSGPAPRVGETWLIDNTLGEWSFAVCRVAKPPTVTGNTGGNVVMDALLDALEASGIIINETTSIET